jgi:membrane protein
MLRSTVKILKETAKAWMNEGCPRMAAALSYYTLFSMAPLLLLTIAVAGLAFGQEATEGKILDQFRGLVGEESARALQSMIAAARSPWKSIWAASIGVITLILGATGVLSELKGALNKIWRAEETGHWADFIKDRAKLFVIVLGIGFLMLVSLLLSAMLALLGEWFAGHLPLPESAMHGVDFLFSFSVITTLFAMLFKYLPDIHIPWREVWIGAAGTALLFTVGKFALGFYLGKGGVGSSYGAAGSVMIILMWVYYSSMIFYFGAQFTRIYAERSGVRFKKAR